MKLTVVAIVLLLVVQCLVVEAAWFFSSSSSSRSRGRQPTTGRRAHDVRTQSGLTSLYNQRVVHAQRVRRPLGSSSTMVGPLSHSGVVVTTANGRRFLVHKGDGYGRTSQTVVTDARHMSGRWRPTGSRSVATSRVGDYVRAGGRDYSLLRNNCHGASCRMMGLP